MYVVQGDPNVELGGGVEAGAAPQFPDAYALRDLPIVNGSTC